jgi:hypothetical protein
MDSELEWMVIVELLKLYDDSSFCNDWAVCIFYAFTLTMEPIVSGWHYFYLLCGNISIDNKFSSKLYFSLSIKLLPILFRCFICRKQAFDA